MLDAEQLRLEACELLRRRQVPQALACFYAAEARGADPDACAGGRWLASMLLGKLEDAWLESDAIRRRGFPDPHRFWNGESTRGKSIIVRCLHGFGDTVQFARYLPLLHRQAANVILEVAPHVLPLARHFSGVDQLICWGDAASAGTPHWDIQIEITELAYVFRTQLNDLPIATRYLAIPDSRLRDASLSLHNTSQPRIGVVWSSGEWDLSRSIPLATLEPLLRRSGCCFFNLQGGSVRNQWKALQDSPSLCDEPRFCNDAGLLPLAAFLAQLDLVLTVDTLAAHLAGALGVPAWIMLQHRADWRWMIDRDDSPWYPSLRLFRQPQPQDWAAVVRAVDRALTPALAGLNSRQVA